MILGNPFIQPDFYRTGTIGRSLPNNRQSSQQALSVFLCKKGTRKNRVPFCCEEDKEFYRLLDPFKTKMI